MQRSVWSVLLVGALMLGSVGAALAHHGWRWTTGGNIEVTGIITAAQLGNPHGVLTVDADGQVWRVEVGQPWRNERAGLKDGDLKKGRRGPYRRRAVCGYQGQAGQGGTPVSRQERIQTLS